jgi:hypothetical protein
MSVQEALSLGIAWELGVTDLFYSLSVREHRHLLSCYHCYVFYQEIESQVSQNGYGKVQIIILIIRGVQSILVQTY